MAESTSTEPEVKTETKDVKFYNAHEGLRGRDGGPYGDQIEMEQAERLRARIEDREPDYKTMSPTAGVPLVPISGLSDNLNSAPSMAAHPAFDEAMEKARQAVVDSDASLATEARTVAVTTVVPEESAGASQTAPATKAETSKAEPAKTAEPKKASS